MAVLVQSSQCAIPSALKSAVSPDLTKQASDDRLRVTVLSGFLGSGKTTLLTNILKSPDHHLRIAVIVNDMAAINVDGQHIRNFDPRASKNKTIEFENGCICCTLRGDLLAELGRLALDHQFDYVIIESSGVSEPMNVAETFALEFSDIMDGDTNLSARDRRAIERIAQKGGLNQIAMIDTMVTVIDSTRLINDFFTADLLSTRWTESGYVPDEDNRTIPDLLVDQIEFANVILINKSDMVDKPTLDRTVGLVKAMNPHAELVVTNHSRIAASKVVGTGLFDYDDAKALPGWLQSLHELNTTKLGSGETRLAPKPETLEYGIGSFVYQARRPFHPERLYYALKGKFVLYQGEPDQGGEDDEDGDDDDDDEEMVDQDDNRSDAVDDEVAVRNHREDPIFSNIHRTKGNFWLASRPFVKGAWNSAGAVLTVESDMTTWFCCYPPGHHMNVDSIGKSDRNPWSTSSSQSEIADRIRADFEGEWGDRRQEIVVIGENIEVVHPDLTALFDQCLLNDAEWADWERVMRDKSLTDEQKVEALEERWEGDWWADWFVQDDEDGEDDEEEGGDGGNHKGHHHDHSHGGRHSH